MCHLLVVVVVVVIVAAPQSCTTGQRAMRAAPAGLAENNRVTSCYITKMKFELKKQIEEGRCKKVQTQGSLKAGAVNRSSLYLHVGWLAKQLLWAESVFLYRL